MVNIEQITSTLAKLPDQALQRYAMMHKDDPYIMSLAVSESKRRKEMRAAGQVQGMQQQPKVVDQAVAEMAPQQQMPSMPEEQGIGALPAAAQMNFADGGITGYAGGGQVERYSGESGSFTGVPYADVPASIAAIGVPAAIYQQASSLATRLGTSVSSVLARMGYDVAKAGVSGLAGAGKLAATGPGQVVLAGGIPATQFATDVMASSPKLREAYLDNPMMGAMDPNGALAAAILDQSASGSGGKATQSSQAQTSAAPTAAQGAPTSKPEDISGIDRRLATPGAILPMSANITREGAGGGEGKRNLGAGSRELGAGVPRAAAPAMSIEDRFLAAQNKMTSQPNPFASQESAFQSEAEKLAKDTLASVDARQALFKDAFKGREGRLEERAKELEKSKDANTGLAFLEAGLAIMSTPGGLATAIGKGAREGTAKYAAGIDKLRSAQDKLDDAKDRMEELKLNRDEMSAKERAEAELGIQRTILSGKKDALSSAKTLYGDRSKLSQEILKTTISLEEGDKDRASRDRATAQSAANAKAQIEATLNTPDRLAFQGYLAKTVNAENPKGDPAKAYEAWKAATAANQRVDLSALANLKKDYKEMADYGATEAERAEGRRMLGVVNSQISSLSGMGGVTGGFGAPPPNAVKLISPSK
jgi:hypothetical protein